MHENAERKGRRYVVEGRLRVFWVDASEVKADLEDLYQLEETR
jgi:hypothetical protein